MVVGSSLIVAHPGIVAFLLSCSWREIPGIKHAAAFSQDLSIIYFMSISCTCVWKVLCVCGFGYLCVGEGCVCGGGGCRVFGMCVSLCMCVHVCVCVHLSVCAYVCACVCVCKYAHVLLLQPMPNKEN